MRRLALAMVAGLFIAGCSTSSSTATSTLPPGSSTTRAPAEVATTPTSVPCASGTVSAPWQPTEYETAVCVTDGSTLDLSGGFVGTGGTWPGPPTISNGGALTLISSNASGVNFTASLRAIGVGSATVTVPFVAGTPDCNPTPCTPIPGRPMVWQVKVVG